MSDPKREGYWQRTDKVLPINLDGYVFLMYEDDGQPVLGRMGGTMFLAVFSTMEKLEAYLPILFPPREVPGMPVPTIAIGPPRTKIKQVQEGGTREFIDSIHEGGCRIMIDPYIHEGNTRFTMVKMEGEC